MRTVAVVCCEFHGKSYNRFLNAKSVDRGLAAQNRIDECDPLLVRALCARGVAGVAIGRREQNQQIDIVL